MVQPFKIEIAQAVLTDLHERLDRVRWPAVIPATSWDYGTDLDYMRSLCGYWRNNYSWRHQEAQINSYPHLQASIDGTMIHCLHVRSRDEHALPLLLLHGWPGSFYDFMKMIPLLREGSPSFHLVIPSLPGYGFSSPTLEPGWNTQRIARALAELMARLGYERYGCHGGDWGSLISTEVARIDPQHVCGIHLSSVYTFPEAHERIDLSDSERAALDDWAGHEQAMVHGVLNTLEPDTLAYAFADSPTGLLAWLVKRFRDWSDCGGDVRSRFTEDELLTNVMIYWVTNTSASAARLYYETVHSGLYPLPAQPITVPVGCAIFPLDHFRPSRRWAERLYDVRRWSEMSAGGHFPALEEPGALAGEVRAFFSELDGGGPLDSHQPAASTNPRITPSD